MMHRSDLRFQRRVHRVLRHIDMHLDEPLELAVLSRLAHLSPFHFHRMFRAWMGETCAAYLRRRRLELAAMRLAAQPALGVFEVALAVGFGSGEAFTRAFRVRFGTSPRVWRQLHAARHREAQKLRKSSQISGTAIGEHVDIDASGDHSMGIRFVQREAIRIAYLRRLGGYDADGLKAFWNTQVNAWLMESGLMAQARYGMCLDDPSITLAEHCRYDAGVIVSDTYLPTHGAELMTLPGGRYAVCRLKDGVEDLAEVWCRLLREWLPESGLMLDARPCFEVYPPAGTGDSITCELHVPVAAVSAGCGVTP